MTICNMSIEAGARAGMVAPDDTTFAYVEGKPYAPKGDAWEPALEHWRTLPTDDGAAFDTEVVLDAAALRPFVSWGTNPAQSTTIDGVVPDPGDDEAAHRALRYMDLAPGTPMRDIRPDTIFIGSCTNSRIEDLRVAADVVRGRKVKDGLRALVVPGSVAVKLQAEQEGLDEVFSAAGFEWRGAGCSMCLGMNPDILGPGDRSASHQQPQLRGPPGQGRPDAPGQPARGGRHRDRRPLHDPGGPVDGARDARRGHGAAGGPSRRRHRPDHPRAST